MQEKECVRSQEIDGRSLMRSSGTWPVCLTTSCSSLPLTIWRRVLNDLFLREECQVLPLHRRKSLLVLLQKIEVACLTDRHLWTSGRMVGCFPGDGCCPA